MFHIHKTGFQYVLVFKRNISHLKRLKNGNDYSTLKGIPRKLDLAVLISDKIAIWIKK